MNIQEYIESGILEQYVIGSLSIVEMLEVESMIAQHPEIKNEVRAIENSFQLYATGNAVKPTISEDELIQNVTGKPSSSSPSSPTDSSNLTNSTDTTISTNPLMSLLKQWLPWLILVPTCLAFLYKSNKVNEAYGKLDQSFTDYKVICEKNSKITEAYKQYIIELMDPQSKKVNLKGTALSPNSYASLLVKKDKKILLSVQGLPQPPSDKQYQLWALKDGKPIDMGVFATNDSTLIEINDVDGAQAYAITLEKAGGVPSPTMESMYVMGEVQ